MSCVDINYQIVRSARRKTIGLQVKAGKVVVRAPTFVDEDYIRQLIKDKSVWLQAKINQQLLHLNAQSAMASVIGDGSVIWVAGKRKTLCVTYAGEAPIKSNDSHVFISLPRIFVEQEDKQTRAIIKALETWFKAVAAEYLPKRIACLSEQTQLSYTSFKIRKYKARWGSCNSRKELSFNYFLMMLPARVIDYVIIHELCHLKHLNHSRDFWQLVQHFLPSYQQDKIWLKQHQYQLSLS